MTDVPYYKQWNLNKSAYLQFEIKEPKNKIKHN